MATAPAMTNREALLVEPAARPASPVFGGVIVPVPVPVAGGTTVGAAGATAASQVYVFDVWATMLSEASSAYAMTVCVPALPGSVAMRT